jgi:acetyltransferase
MLESLFRPKSAAVIGASSKELSIGNRVIKNLIDFGFKGEIYPINPKADEKKRGEECHYQLRRLFRNRP